MFVVRTYRAGFPYQVDDFTAQGVEFFQGHLSLFLLHILELPEGEGLGTFHGEEGDGTLSLADAKVTTTCGLTQAPHVDKTAL